MPRRVHFTEWLTIAAIQVLALNFAGWGLAASLPAVSSGKPESDRVERLSLPGAALPLGPMAMSITAGSCSGRWQGPEAFYLGCGWLTGDETVAAYQDPTASGCVTKYPFIVTDVVWIVWACHSATVDLQPLIYEDGGTSMCPLPGSILCQGPVYSVNLPASGAWIVTMSLGQACPVQGPYFAAVSLPTAYGPGVVDLVIDDGATVTPKMCRNYDNSGTGWEDLVAVWHFNNTTLWSEALTSPVARDTAWSTLENTSRAVGYLPASDPNNDPLTFSVSRPPEHGSISGFNASNGAFTYTPASGYVGSDSLLFLAGDGSGTGAGAVRITVTAATQPPTACVCCPCLGDPDCNGVIDVLDVVKTICPAFRGCTPTKDPTCPVEREDFNANGKIDVLDVVGVIGYAFRGGPGPTCPPCAPVIQVAAGDAQVTVSWAPVAGAASYNLYYATAPGVTPANYPSWPGGTRIVGAASPQVVTGLTNGTTYYVVGTAVYPGGESEKSAEVQATPNATNTACPVVINEVMFYPDPASTEPIRTHEWVELFNPGPDCNIAGWIISNRDASADALLPNWIFPANSYLVVHFTTGTNDNDFSDAEGDFYAGNADVFSDVMDECALYTGAPGSGTIRDFIAWTRDETITFTGGTAHGHAVSAAMWTAGDYLDAASAGTSDEEKIQSLFAGVTIGRDKDSHDSNLSGDWGIDGGPDAIDMTPGALNFSPMGIAIGPPEPTNGLKANKKWTFMVYLDGDNDLEKYAFDDLNEMERVGSDANVNIVVEFDSWNKAHEVVLQDGKWVPVAGTYKEAWRGIVKQDNNSSIVTLYPPAGDEPRLREINMGSPATFGEFVTWATSKFPADHYALVVWDHGSGWKGVCTDDNNGKDRLYMGELDAALSPAPYLDAIAFDACEMAAIEVADQVYFHAGVFVASEGNENARGYPYDRILSGLRGTPTWTGASLASRIVSDFAASNDGRDEDYTLSASRLNLDFVDLVTNVSAFASDLKVAVADFQNEGNLADNVQLGIRQTLSETHAFDDPNFIDLYDFANRVGANGSIPAAYKANVGPVKDRLAPKGNAGVVVFAERHGVNHNPDAWGLTIYFPSWQTIQLTATMKTHVVPQWTKVEEEVNGKPVKVWKLTKTLEHPYDKPWPSHLTDEASGLAQYASDPDDCTPIGNPKNHPYPPTPGFRFANDTQWDEFLHRYYEPVADCGEHPYVTLANQPVTLDGQGSSDADRAKDGMVERYFWDLDPSTNTDAGDWDKNCKDETNDDRDDEGAEVVFVRSDPGFYPIVLTVWDDHNSAEHPGSEHYETSQDSSAVWVLPGAMASMLPADNSEASVDVVLDYMQSLGFVDEALNSGQVTVTDIRKGIRDFLGRQAVQSAQ